MRLVQALTPLFAGLAPALIGIAALSILGATALALAADVVICALAGAVAFYALARLAPPPAAEEPA